LANRYSGKELKLDAHETDVTSSNLICKREVFKKVRFDEDLYPGEDPKFIADAKENGFKVAYDPSIKGYNRRRQGLFELGKQIFKYGEVRPKKEGFFETIRRPYFFIPSIFVIYLVLMIVLLLVYPSKILLIPLGCYLFLNGAFSLYCSFKNKNLKVAPLLFIIYPTIHISYGMGMILGYIL
jgi:hypothetical protein